MSLRQFLDRKCLHPDTTCTLSFASILNAMPFYLPGSYIYCSMSWNTSAGGIDIFVFRIDCKHVISKHMLTIKLLCVYLEFPENATEHILWWVNIRLGNILVPSTVAHYLGHSWPRSMSPNGATEQQWVVWPSVTSTHITMIPKKYWGAVLWAVIVWWVTTMQYNH